MIFLTVGSELPFDRLSKAMDEWCGENPEINVFGQIADPGAHGYQPRNFKWKPFVSPEEYKKRFDTADLIVAHAGMGAIITALMMRKPIIIMPRRYCFKETRNDHQVATANYFAKRQGIFLAEDEAQIGSILYKWNTIPPDIIVEEAQPFAEEKLIGVIKNFIWSSRKLK